MSPLTKVLIGLAAAALSLCLCGGIVAVINGSGPSAPDNQAADAARVLDPSADTPPTTSPTTPATTPATTAPTTPPAAAPTIPPTSTPPARPKPKPKPKPKKSTKAPAPPADSQDEDDSVYYANCTAVRDAGKAPIRRGQPGYSRKLDRDGDGVACEK
ncbi:excalibur calcium-binding domain-containing protein [Actinoplanes sp. NPDC089786]|uniref:excalibur calcium-binding domain-containing protein n=1 Tax=Actinoplanes sp. NPDC089786 TaxID=3155185 RepID=UPI00341A61FD